MSAGPVVPNPFRRRLFWARVGARMTGRSTALELGLVLLVTAGAYVLGVRGVIGPSAWLAGLAAGLGYVALRVIFGLFDSGDDPELLREVLADHFGEEIRDDPDVTQRARQVIEQRLQLANALTLAPAGIARKTAHLLPALDHRLDSIAYQARKAATRRGTARFQAGMAELAKRRLDEVERIAEAPGSANAATARRTASDLTAQVKATNGLVDFEENRLMVLDQSVAEFGTFVTRALLALSKADAAALDDLAHALARSDDGDPGRT